MFRVKDTGIGLEPTEFKRIFNPFEQADVSVARSFGGTGLGLTISASLVAHMGGKFYVSSRGKGLGATFQYFIPYIPAEPSYAPPPSPTTLARTAGDRRRLLLAASRLSMSLSILISRERTVTKQDQNLHQ